MKLIVALGNPGEKYTKTRHNIGFMLLDKLAQDENLTWKENKKLHCFSCKWGETTLVKPTTFMNNSGQAVQAVLAYYNLIPKKFRLFAPKDSDLSNFLTIIHDDLDIEFGKFKESLDSRSAGHRGVQSIINHLKTKNFRRIRIGIKNELLGKVIPVKNFVLQRFSKEEIKKIEEIIPEIIERLFPKIKN